MRLDARGLSRGGIALAFLVMGFVGAAVASAQDLKGHWPLDESDDANLSVFDFSTFGNNGTRTPTQGGTDTPAKISTDVAPIPGTPSLRSILCNADTDRPEGAEIADQAGSSLNFTGPFTISVWVKLGATGPARTDNMGVVERLTNPGTGYSGYFLRLYRRDVGGSIVYTAGFTTSNNGVQSSIGAPDSQPIPRGAWTHLAAVFTGTELILYQNGTNVASGAGSAPGAVNTGLSIGNDKGSNRFHGNVDEVRVYGRGLSATEVGVLINGQPPATGLTAVGDVNRIDLSWTAAAGASSYTIWRSTTSGGGYVSVGTSSSTTFSDPGVTFPTTYYYVVTAMSVLASVNSNEASATPLSPAPRANDHEEGLLDGGKCSCGSAPLVGDPRLIWLGLALALVALAGVRRS